MSLLTASWEPDFIRSVIHPSSKITFADLTIALPATMLCVELAIVSILHMFAFSAKVYDIRLIADVEAAYSGKFMGLGAIGEALNFWDIIKSSARSIRYMLSGHRKREMDISYEGHRYANDHGPVELGDIQTPDAFSSYGQDFEHGKGAGGSKWTTVEGYTGEPSSPPDPSPYSLEAGVREYGGRGRSHRADLGRYSNL